MNDRTNREGAAPPGAPTEREKQLEKQLADTRREAAGYRSGNKGQMAEFTRGLAGLAGIEAEGADAATLIARLQERDDQRVAEVREARVAKALAERLHKNNVDYGSASLVRAALSDTGVLKSLDPAAEDFADQLDDHIKELLDEHPRLRGESNRLPSKSGSELTGGNGLDTSNQLTHAELAFMSPEEIVEARKAGRLDMLLGRWK